MSNQRAHCPDCYATVSRTIGGHICAHLTPDHRTVCAGYGKPWTDIIWEKR